jgi:hypothetical protein
MENVPCEVFMNETKTEITLIQEKRSQPTNPRKCCPRGCNKNNKIGIRKVNHQRKK